MGQHPDPRTARKTPGKMALFQLRNILIIFIVISPLALYLLTTELTMDAVPIDKQPYTHFNGLDPAREYYVSWETGKVMNGSVWLGTTRENLALNSTNASYSTVHHVKLTNLAPNTRYYYRVVSNGTGASFTSPVGTFTTAPITALPFTAAFFSDSQQLFGLGCYERIAKALASRNDLAFASPLGDLCQEPENQANWNLFMKQGELWMQKVPIVPSIGNHDSTYNSGTGLYDDLDQFMYLKYFGFSYDSGPWANHLFYSFNWSDVQFVIGEIGEGGQEDISRMNQSAWFNQTLVNGQDKAFRVLVFHRSMFSSLGGSEGLIDRIVPIVEKYNVSLVMYGHDHHYERFLVNGHTYMCLGGGGVFQDVALNIQPGSQFINLGPSYTTVHFDIDRLVIGTWSEENALIESVTLVRNGSRADVLNGGVL